MKKRKRTPDEERPSREYRETRIRELRGHAERIRVELAANKKPDRSTDRSATEIISEGREDRF